jgi:hypothetical protein
VNSKPQRVCAAVLCVFACCATLKTPDMEALKPAIEKFHQQARWKDFRGASDFLVEERREAFIEARSEANDDKDLFITDFSLEDATVSQDKQRATAVSKISWYRMPNATENQATVTSVFVWRDGRWLLESQKRGPFPELAAQARDGGQ